MLLGTATIGSLAASGCTGPCSRLSYSQGLLISIDSGPAAADYELLFDHGHGILMVDYTVMADGHVQCLEDCADRDADFIVEPDLATTTATELTSSSVALAVSGAEDFHDLPHELHLTVLRDGVTVHDQAYAPDYKHWDPNGCGEAVVGHIDLTLPQ